MIQYESFPNESIQSINLKFIVQRDDLIDPLS